MNIEKTIQAKLEAAFTPLHLAIVNESHRHAMGAENSHFHITLVSQTFDGQGLVARHRAVYKTLAAELAGPVHALTLHTLTPEEWRARGGQVAPSPSCQGGKRQAAQDVGAT